MTRQAINLKGLKVGKWTVIARHGTCQKSLQATWVVECECGAVEVALAGEIKRRGPNSACGQCLRLFASSLNRTHGESKHYLHNAWRAMRRRCRPTYRQAHRYSERGISVHPPWEQYEVFARYVRRYLGERPSADHSIDRINNDEGYRPGNLRWATRKEQAANRHRHPGGWKWAEHKKGPRKGKTN